MTVARELAEFLTRASPSDLPPQAVDHAAMLIASTLASAAFGAGLESVGIIRDLARERGGRPDASLWFTSGPKLPVADAAQVNAVASDAAASDDSDLRNIVHAGTTLVATALAVAERTGAGGEDVLAAIVLGYEAAGRIGEAITPGFRTRGFHGCLIAIFAGTVAAGRLLDLEAAPMAQAIAFQAQPRGRPSRQGLQMSLVALGRHYIRDGTGTEQLFDLGRDPFETVNLIGSAQGNRDVGLFQRMLLELLRDNAEPSEEEIRAGLSGNLCMCTGYVNIVRAVRAAAGKFR